MIVNGAGHRVKGGSSTRATLSVVASLVVSICLASVASAQSLTLGLGRLEGTITERGHARSIRSASVEAIRLDAEPAMSFHAVPDTRGRFHIDSLPAGRYMVQVASATLDSLELALQANEQLILAGGTSKADFALPAGSALRDAVCRGVKLGDGRGVVVGHGFNADTEEPLTNAKVVVSWHELKVDKGTLKFGRVQRDGVVETGPRGEYRLCGVPTGSLLTIQLQTAERAGGVARVTVSDEDGAVVRDLSLSIQTAAMIATLDSLERVIDALGARVVEDSNAVLTMSGTATVSGVVRGAGNQPLADAEVRLANTLAIVNTDAAGRFSLNMLPSGTQLLYVRRLGYATTEADVELRAGKSLIRDIQLSRFASLDSIRIVAQGVRYAEFERHRGSNFFGKFFTSDEIDKHAPQELTDLFSHIAGFTVTGRGPDAVVTSDLAKGNHPSCTEANVIIDGIPRAGVNLLSVSQVAGVEVYRDQATAPPPYHSECGLIIIWTKVYRPKPKT